MVSYGKVTPLQTLNHIEQSYSIDLASAFTFNVHKCICLCFSLFLCSVLCLFIFHRFFFKSVTPKSHPHETLLRGLSSCRILKNK